MGDSTGPALRHVARFGTTAQPGDTLPGPVAPGMTLNSPVGVALDRAGNVWVCDTGNNRLLVFDASLSTLRHVLHAPESAAGGEAARAFRMPFHVCPHPKRTGSSSPTWATAASWSSTSPTARRALRGPWATRHRRALPPCRIPMGSPWCAARRVSNSASMTSSSITPRTPCATAACALRKTAFTWGNSARSR
ncbi:MAG: hypothetical protein IPJ99_01265 [Betaproteobacteria bacterium]|nr:hypothetical protein [Betaproteobacteria bacterium]